MVKKNYYIARGDPGNRWGNLLDHRNRLRIFGLSIRIRWLKFRLRGHLLIRKYTLRVNRYFLQGSRDVSAESEVQAGLNVRSRLKSEVDPYALKPLTTTRR